MLIMENGRYPKTLLCALALLDLKLIDNNNSNIERYNWTFLVKKTFFIPLEELTFFENLEAFETLKYPNMKKKLLHKYSRYLRIQDRNKSSQSSS